MSQLFGHLIMSDFFHFLYADRGIKYLKYPEISMPLLYMFPTLKPGLFSSHDSKISQFSQKRPDLLIFLVLAWWYDHIRFVSFFVCMSRHKWINAFQDPQALTLHGSHVTALKGPKTAKMRNFVHSGYISIFHDHQFIRFFWFSTCTEGSKMAAFCRHLVSVEC